MNVLAVKSKLYLMEEKDSMPLDDENVLIDDLDSDSVSQKDS